MRKVNYKAVLTAIVVTFILSAIWYTVFSNQYFTLRGIDPNDGAATGMQPWQVLVVFIRHAMVIFVMEYAFIRMGIKDVKSGLSVGLLLWLGFPAVLLLGSVVSDNVPVPLAVIHGGDWLIKLMAIGFILSAWSGKEKHKNID